MRLEESDARQDITYLSHKSRGDARSVAMAVLADEFSHINAPAVSTPTPAPVPTATPASAPEPTLAPRVSLAPEFYYALFRAGVPADVDGVFRTEPGTVQAIWRQAIAQGVIPQSLSAQVPTAVQNFQALAASNVLSAAPKTGDDLSKLQKQLAQIAYKLPAAEQQSSTLGQATQDAVAQFQTASGLPVTGVVDATTAGAIGQAVNEVTYTVSGAVTSATGVGVGGLSVQLVDKNVGGDVTSPQLTPAATAKTADCCASNTAS